MYELEMIYINIIKQKYLNCLKMSLQNILFLGSINLIALSSLVWVFFFLKIFHMQMNSLSTLCHFIPSFFLVSYVNHLSKWLRVACEHSPCFHLEVFAFFYALEALLAILKRRQRVWEKKMFGFKERW